jgi:hypothetical protein
MERLAHVQIAALPLVLLLLSACGVSSSSSPPSAAISMVASDWSFTTGAMPVAHPTAASRGWSFNFPIYDHVPSTDCVVSDCPRVGYVTTPTSINLTEKTMSMKFQVVATGEPVFQYALNPNNTCGGAATVSLFIQRLGDTGYGEFDRWFTKSSIILANGKGTLSVEVSPDKWISVYGRDGTDPAAATGWRTVLSNVGAVGFVFGGGCFAGHGVNIKGGTATFQVSQFGAFAQD